MSVKKQFKLLSVLLVLSVCIFSLSLNGQSRQKDYKFFIVQMTDPQFGFFGENREFSKETLLYEKAVEKINRLKPAFVVITGDFVNQQSNRAQWNEFDRITGKISKDIPVWLSPGNHDIGQSPSQEDIDNYTAKYGYDRFAFRFKKCLFVGLNTCIIKSGNPEREQIQYEWLEKELRKARRCRHILLFSHYPFFIKSEDEPETYSNIGPGLREKYLELFRKYDVSAVFSGHLHNNAESAFGDTEMVVTSAVGRPLGEAPSGFRIIKFSKERIDHEYYPLDEVPDQVMNDLK